jgi:MFS family permease
VVAGFVTIGRDRRLVLVAVLGIAQTVTRGCLTVLAVVLALDLLDLGDPGVATLNAAVGAGGVLGSFAAFALTRRGGLGTWFGVGIALFGAPLVLVGVLPSTVSAVLMLALVGVGNALIDVCAFTMLARLTDEAVLARMFAGFEALLTLGVAVGGVAAPLVVSLLGPRGALVVVGLLTPVVVLASVPALRRLDAELRTQDGEVEVLRRVPMLAALPAATIGQLASAVRHVRLAPGEDAVAEGDHGDEFFVVVDGRAEVLQHGVVINGLGPGDSFGEVALLEDTPRTATVRAGDDGPLVLASLSRQAFLTAVTGYPASATLGSDFVAGVRRRDAERDAGG